MPGGESRTRRNWNSNAMAYDARSLGDGLELDINRVMAVDIVVGGGLEFSSGKLTLTATTTVVTKTTTYTALVTDRFIICNSASAFTVTLPTAVGNTGLVLDIKNKGTGIITVDGAGSEKIETELNQTLGKGDDITIFSDNVEWWII